MRCVCTHELAEHRLEPGEGMEVNIGGCRAEGCGCVKFRTEAD